MIKKTQEELQEEFSGLFGIPLEEQPVHGRKVVAFEISDVQFRLLADAVKQREAAIQTIAPTSGPERHVSDEELVVRVYQLGLHRTLSRLYESIEILEEVISEMEREEK